MEKKTEIISEIKDIVLANGFWGTGLCGFNSLAVCYKSVTPIEIDVKGYPKDCDWMNGVGNMYDVVVCGGKDTDEMRYVVITTIKKDDEDAFCRTNAEDLSEEKLSEILAFLKDTIDKTDMFCGKPSLADIVFWYGYAEKLGREMDAKDLSDLREGKLDVEITDCYKWWHGYKPWGSYGKG